MAGVIWSLLFGSVKSLAAVLLTAVSGCFSAVADMCAGKSMEDFVTDRHRNTQRTLSLLQFVSLLIGSV